MSCDDCQGPLQAPPGKGPVRVGGLDICWDCFQKRVEVIKQGQPVKNFLSPDSRTPNQPN